MKQEKRGLDPKQVFYALVGGVLGVGFLFLIGSHVYKSLQDPASTSIQKPQSASHASAHVGGYKPKIKQNSSDYAFFALLDKPVPKRDAPHLNLALNPVQEKKDAIAKRAQQEAESSGALVAKGNKSSKAGKIAKGDSSQMAKDTKNNKENGKDSNKNSKLLGENSSGELKLDPSESLGLGYQSKTQAKTKAANTPTGLGAGKGTGRAQYTVQVGAFQDQGVAEGLMLDLNSRGYDAYISPEQVPGKGTMYRVRVGRFEHRNQADTLSKQVKEKDGIGGFVTGM